MPIKPHIALLPLPALCAACLLLLLARPVYAQPAVDTIKADPAAVQLKVMWLIRGKKENDNIGLGYGSVGDVNGDGINDFGVRNAGYWDVYLGRNPAPSDTAYWRFPLLTTPIDHPITGRFWGDGRQAFGFFVYTQPDSFGNYESPLHFFHWPDGKPNDTPTAIINTKNYCMRDGFSADLDGDGADEYIQIQGCNTWEALIYKGGPNFPADTPMVRISSPSSFSAEAGDFDGDGAVDLMMSGNFEGGAKIKFFWGDPRDSMAWTRWKSYELKALNPNSEYDFVKPLDCDGDGVHDIILSRYTTGEVYLYRSKAKNARTRSFTYQDADKIFYKGYPFPLGFVNDAARRYEMLRINLGLLLRGFSGGLNGPDANYKVYFEDGLEDFYLTAQPIPDVNGDGWDDVITGSFGWYSGLRYGLAAVFAGGPYIPRDPSIGVREVPITGEDKPTLFCWPVPMHDQLNIAWHGNMKRFPARFTVHDATGRLVATGDVDPYQGSALWCPGPGIPAGFYLLSVFDANGQPLGWLKVLRK